MTLQLWVTSLCSGPIRRQNWGLFRIQNFVPFSRSGSAVGCNRTKPESDDKKEKSLLQNWTTDLVNFGSIRIKKILQEKSFNFNENKIWKWLEWIIYRNTKKKSKFYDKKFQKEDNNSKIRKFEEEKKTFS